MTPLGPEQLARTGERHGVRSVEHVTVIRVIATRGLGEYDSPIREVVTYWTPEGHRLVELDPCGGLLDAVDRCFARAVNAEQAGATIPKGVFDALGDLRALVEPPNTTGGHP